MITATEPLVVTISHRLGRDEAKRRVDRGLEAVRGEVAQYVSSLDYHWEDYRLEFRVVAMLQTITGRIEVLDDAIRIELGLPRLQHLIGRSLAGRIEQRARMLLEPPKT